MKRTRSLWLASVLAGSVGLSSVAGCGGSSGGTTIVQVQSGQTEFVVANQSAMSICYVNVSSSSEPNWGPDQLGAAECIGPGQQRGWAVTPGRYDFRLQDVNHNTLMERRGVDIVGGGLFITFRAPE